MAVKVVPMSVPANMSLSFHASNKLEMKAITTKLQAIQWARRLSSICACNALTAISLTCFESSSNTFKMRSGASGITLAYCLNISGCGIGPENDALCATNCSMRASGDSSSKYSACGVFRSTGFWGAIFLFGLLAGLFFLIFLFVSLFV